MSLPAGSGGGADVSGPMRRFTLTVLLMLWLGADAGATENTGKVSTCTDQSGNDNHVCTDTDIKSRDAFP